MNWLWQEIEEDRGAGVLLLRRPTTTPSLSSREFGRWKMKCGEWTAGVREQSVFLPSSVNNITFSSLPDCMPDSLEAANSVGLKKVVGGQT